MDKNEKINVGPKKLPIKSPKPVVLNRLLHYPFLMTSLYFVPEAGASSLKIVILSCK